MSIEFERADLRSKEDVIKLLEYIGNTIIERASDIACDPILAKGITLTAEIMPWQIVTIKWNVEAYADERVNKHRQEQNCGARMTE